MQLLSGGMTLKPAVLNCICKHEAVLFVDIFKTILFVYF